MKRIFQSRAAIIFFAALTLCTCGKKAEPAKPPEPPAAKPPSVLVVEAKPADVPLFGVAVARLKGSVETPVHASVSGYLVKQAYPDGAEVKAGDLLFFLNTEPFQPGSDYTKIIAPAAGVAAKATPGLGDLVKPETTLTTISAIDPILAEFILPAATYQKSAERLQQIMSMHQESRPENITLTLADGKLYPRKGRVASITSVYKSPLSPITIDVLFPNPDHLLKPGDYVSVRAEN